MVLKSPFTALVASLAVVQSTTLYTSNYDGTVATLSLNRLPNGSYSFTKTSSIRSCGNSPSWLTYDSATSTLYCSDEFMYQNGSLTSYTPTSSGLTPQVSVKTVGGGVSSVEYGGSKGNSFIAIAHYDSSTVSTFALPITSSSTAKQVFTYKLSQPGPNRARQQAPHPHQVILDPTGNSVLAPDLGADLVRIYSINNSTGALTACTPYSAPPGSGPRHIAFKILPSGNTVAYLANEFAVNVTALEVRYQSQGCPTLVPFQTSYAFPNNTLPPAGSTVAEIRVVENNVYVTNRNTSTSLVDSLSTFSLNPSSGTLQVQAVTSTTGSWPRTLAFNKNGTLAAVGNQDSGQVVVFARNCSSGLLSKTPVASLVVGSGGRAGIGGLSSVIFAE